MRTITYYKFENEVTDDKIKSFVDWIKKTTPENEKQYFKNIDDSFKAISVKIKEDMLTLLNLKKFEEMEDNEKYIALNNDEKEVIKIIASVPKEGSDEREEILSSTNHILVKWRETSHYGVNIFGLICIDEDKNLTIRFKQSNPKSLELATEIFLNKVISNGKNVIKLIALEQKIPVREPNQIDNIYYGRIFLGFKSLSRSIREKRTDFIISLLFIFLFLICLFIGYSFFTITKNPNDIIRWWSGFWDRLATTFIVSAFISILNFFFYYLELKKKKLIDWNEDE